MEGLSAAALGVATGTRGCASDTIDAYRFGNVLQGLSAHILEAGVDLVPDGVEGHAGNQHATRFRDTFKTGRDVDAVTIEIAALDHDVTEVDTDAQHDVASFRQIAVRGGHAVLQFDRALHRVYRTAELDEHAVAGDLEDAALVADDQGLQHLLPPGLERGQRAGLVVLHEPAVTNYVGGEDGGKAALNASFGHVVGCSRKRNVRDFSRRVELYWRPPCEVYCAVSGSLRVLPVGCNGTLYPSCPIR